MSRLRRMLRLATITIAAALLAACVSTPSQPSPSKRTDLSGEWVLTTESQVGTQDALMTVRQTGKALAGTISGQMGTVDLTGSADGAAVAFNFTLNVHGKDLKVAYSGAVDGDTLKGTAVIGQIGEGTFTARRKSVAGVNQSTNPAVAGSTAVRKSGSSARR